MGKKARPETQSKLVRLGGTESIMVWGFVKFIYLLFIHISNNYIQKGFGNPKNFNPFSNPTLILPLHLMALVQLCSNSRLEKPLDSTDHYC